MSLEISKNRGDALTIAVKVLSGSFRDICVSLGKEVIGKLSNGSLEVDAIDETMFYCKLTSTQTSKYISPLPLIVAVDYENMGVRKFKQKFMFKHKLFGKCKSIC